MQVVLAALVGMAGILLSAAFCLGFLSETAASTLLHVKAGILAAVFTMFIHCLVMFYLIGTGKDIKEAVEGVPDLEEIYFPFTKKLKRTIFPFSSLSILLILVASIAGAWVHSEILAGHRDGVFPVRAVPVWWLHLALTVPALAVNVLTFVMETRGIRENVQGIQDLNRELARRFGKSFEKGIEKPE